ncbi:hypothetical protein [Microbacterium paludicola]|uniref:hypothetical protein n=1 Tax=Microbacterium paludicola TaxID=300019 RepID=UPI0031E1E5A5
MSSPQQPPIPPVPPPPAPGGWQQPAGYGAPGYGAPAAPYQPPQDPRYAQYLQAPPAPKPSSGLGMVALILSLVATIGGSILLAVALSAIGNGLGARFETITPGSGMEVLTPVRDWVLVAEIAAWGGTALGIWALVQGIVAVAKRRGRGPGIAAIVIAALGPFIAVAAAFLGAVAGVAGSGAV